MSHSKKELDDIHNSAKAFNINQSAKDYLNTKDYLDVLEEVVDISNSTDPCWKGYKQIGMKDKNGKQVPNCVPESNESYSREGHRHRWVKEDETDFCLDCDEMRPTEYEMGAKGYDQESKTSEGFYQGLHGYVDAKCKTCGGLEFGSIEDMNDHYAMNPDHESNLNDLDNNIPNID